MVLEPKSGPVLPHDEWVPWLRAMMVCSLAPACSESPWLHIVVDVWTPPLDPLIEFYVRERVYHIDHISI